MLLDKPQNAQQYWNQRAELFSGYYTAPTLFDRVFRAGIYTRTAVALQVCQEHPGTTVLDIGSGPGENSIVFLKNSPVARLTGIDFAPSMNEAAMAACAEQAVSDRAEFVLGDFLTHDWRGQEFGVSVALGVLDYVAEAAEFLARIDEVTTRAFVISWPENGLRMLLRRRRYKCPVYHYTQSQVRQLHRDNCEISSLEFVKSRGGWVTIARK